MLCRELESDRKKRTSFYQDISNLCECYIVGGFILFLSVFSVDILSFITILLVWLKLVYFFLDGEEGRG